MGLPRQLKNFNTFVDGDSFLGEMSEVNLGKIAEKVESIRTAGLLGEIDTAMGLDKFEIEMKSAGLADRLLTKFGRVGVASTLLRFVGAYQEDVEGGVMPGELVVRGRIPEIDPGTAKVGDKTEWSAKMTCTYVKWSLGGRELIRIDWLNAVYIVDGEDRYAQIRAAMGL